MILDILTSAESAVGYRLGRDYELMIKFNPSAFLAERMMIQTEKEKIAITFAEYIERIKVRIKLRNCLSELCTVPGWPYCLTYNHWTK